MPPYLLIARMKLVLALLFGSLLLWKVVNGAPQCNPTVAFDCITRVFKRVLKRDGAIDEEKYCPNKAAVKDMVPRCHKNNTYITDCNSGTMKKITASASDLLVVFKKMDELPSCQESAEPAACASSAGQCYDSWLQAFHNTAAVCVSADSRATYQRQLNACDNLHQFCADPDHQQKIHTLGIKSYITLSECDCEAALTSAKNYNNRMYSWGAGYKADSFCRSLDKIGNYRGGVFNVWSYTNQCKDQEKLAPILHEVQLMESRLAKHGPDCLKGYKAQAPPSRLGSGVTCKKADEDKWVKTINDCLTEANLEHDILESDEEICKAVEDSLSCSKEARGSYCSNRRVYQAVTYINRVTQEFKENFKCPESED